MAPPVANVNGIEMVTSRQAIQEIIPEILRQLNHDILYYGWLRQLVRLPNPAFTDRECVDVALDAVLVLHHECRIVVGDACDTDGMVRIQPWPEENEDLFARLQSTLSRSYEHDQSFCFWIQLLEHYRGNASCEPITQSDSTTQVSEIKLRSVAQSDLPILFDHQREPEANEMAAFPARDHDAFMAHWKKIMADEALVAMTAVVDNRIAGHIGSWTQDGQRHVGYWIGKVHWGKGVATQVLSMFLRVVTDRPIHAYVAKHNVASIRVLEKCGFLLHADFTSAHGQHTDGIEELVYVNSSASS